MFKRKSNKLFIYLDFVKRIKVKENDGSSIETIT